MKTESHTTRERDISLDGLRGVAALSVVAFHFCSAFLPATVPDQSPTVPPWSDSPLEVVLNGPFWVFVFFVLSGYVLAMASRRPRTHFWRDVGARYLRLALPATASVLLAWILLSLFPLATTHLNALAPSPWFRWTLQGEIPSLFAAVKDGMFGIFRRGGSQFNNVLWTMRIELIGSLGVYAFFQVVRRHRLLAAVSCLIALVGLGAPPGYVAFALGATLSIATHLGFRLRPWLALLAFACGLLLGSEATGFADRHGFGNWPVAIRPGAATGMLYPLGALAVVAGVLGSKILQRTLEVGPCRLLGRLSFPLYLVHAPLLYTVVAVVAARLHPLTAPTLFALAVVFLMAAMALAWGFYELVDKPVLAAIRRMSLRTVVKEARHDEVGLHVHVPASDAICDATVDGVANSRRK